jgi:hypothetical protein
MIILQHLLLQQSYVVAAAFSWAIVVIQEKSEVLKHCTWGDTNEKEGPNVRKQG